ncbi:ATP-binding cassette domain-containing protein [Rhizobiales bacterium 3FA27D7]|jgi:putative thiamine transport system ATP-binding protein|uniref:ATP-binding cassette domain-containing protein n=1 Tax=Mesorhizobium sp. 2RAF21 TaxID=3232995 RepID=UPI0010F9B6D0
MTNTLALRSVTISIGDKSLISGLDLVVEPGTVATIMGPSGSGKSTLISFIGGHLDPAFEATGAVLIGNRDVTGLRPERRGIGILFQDDLLFPHLSVGANLAFGLARSVVGSEVRRVRIAEALVEAGLPGFENRDPATLSGGQRARVALMRTLLASPTALLLDEPFSKLDSNLRRDFRRFVFDRAAAKQLPVLLVTHDPADATAAGGPLARL